jgi:hypothetical protein
MGISEPAQEIAQLMVEEAKQGAMLVFHNGDISYARGYVSYTCTYIHVPINYSVKKFINYFSYFKVIKLTLLCQFWS